MHRDHWNQDQEDSAQASLSYKAIATLWMPYWGWKPQTLEIAIVLVVTGINIVLADVSKQFTSDIIYFEAIQNYTI